MIQLKDFDKDKEDAQDDVEIPIGPITRARAKKLQEAVQTLLTQAQGEGSSPHEDLDLKMVNMWQVHFDNIQPN